MKTKRNITTSVPWQSQLGLAYLLSIFGLSLFLYSSALMDPTLLSRLGSASCCLLVFAIFLFFQSFAGNTEIKWPHFNWPIKFLLGYFIWSTLSVAWAVNFSEAIFESQKVMLGLVVFYLTIWLQLNDPFFIARLCKAVAIISIIIIGLSYWQISQVDWSAENAIYEIRGFCGHKNLFSTALFILSGFLGISFFYLEKKWKWLSAFLFFTLIVLILFLKTRSTYLGVLVTGGSFIFFLSRKWLKPKRWSQLGKLFALFSSLILFFGIYLWQSDQLYSALETTKIDKLWQSETGQERLVLWEKTACVISKAPFMGVGAGNWQILYPDCNVHKLYSVETDFTTFQRPHNDWLWVWAETGLIGFLLYIGFFITVLQKGIHNFQKSTFATNGFAISTRLSYIVGFMVIACFSFPKERIELLILIYTLLGTFMNTTIPQTKSGLNWNRSLLIIIALSCALNLYITEKRINGERGMRTVLMMKQQKNWPAVIQATDQAFSKWYTIDPTSIPVHWYRGTAEFTLGNHASALSDFAKAEQYAPYNQHVQNDLGSCYQMTGETEKAKAHYLEAIRISPLFDDPRLNLGISYYNDKKYQEALDWINSISNHDVKMHYRKIIEPKLKQQ